MGIITVRRYTISPLERVKELRCLKCNSLLARQVEASKGKVEVKCRKCKLINKFKLS